MRFRFTDPKASSENAAREKILRKMDDWWSAFATRVASPKRGLFQRPVDMHDVRQIVPFMEKTLLQIDPRLSWEFGPARGGSGHRLVITPESEHSLRPMVAELLRRAPRLDGWEFYDHRPAVPLDAGKAIIAARAGRPVDGWRAALLPTADGGIDLCLWGRQFGGPDQDRALALAFVAAEVLVGEELLDRYIDGIEAAAEPPVGAEDVALEDLSERVSALVQRGRATLPEVPYLDRASALPWTMLKLEPPELDDPPGQADLYVAQTCALELWQRAHSRRLFDSARFSGHGETFCYLKLDRSEAPPPGGLEDKFAILEAVDAAFRPARLGVGIGAGTGRRYSYLDLAVLDVDRAIPVLRSVLRAGKVPERSWLLFHDSALSAEWVGIWDDTPPPPGLPE